MMNTELLGRSKKAKGQKRFMNNDRKVYRLSVWQRRELKCGEMDVTGFNRRNQ